jgi:hypothetical protein
VTLRIFRGHGQGHQGQGHDFLEPATGRAWHVDRWMGHDLETPWSQGQGRQGQGHAKNGPESLSGTASPIAMIFKW